MSILNEISTLLQQGRAPKVKELVAKAIEEGIAPQTILEEGLLGGMSVVGEKFKKNEVQVIIANPQTLKYGITFVNCKYAIYNSLSYSYDDYYQSRDRIYRYGQKSECTYYHLLSEDTIDEQIFRCLQNKHNNSIIFEKLIKSAAKSKFKIESDLIERSLEIARKKAV